MSTPPGALPPELETKAGASVRAWEHLTHNAAVRLPTNLHRANLIRRGMLAMLPAAKGKRH